MIGYIVKRIFDHKTLTYSFPDGSGLQTKELLLRRSLLTDKAKIEGSLGTRNYKEEQKEVDKWFYDYKKLNEII